MISTGFKYSSRIPLISKTESPIKRRFSLLLSAKCFTETFIAFFCTPFTSAAILPASKGFRKILEVAPAEQIALDIRPRTEQNVYSVMRR